MSLDIHSAARDKAKRGFILLGVIGLVLVALVLTAIVTSSGNNSKSSPTAGNSPAPQPGTSGQAAPTPTATADTDGGDFVGPDTWVQLPKGTDTANGLPVKFPHTDQGAAAMEVAAIRASWNLDPNTIINAVETYSVPDEVGQSKALASQAAAGNRQSAGMPTSGPLPSGAAYNAVPIGVQWTEQDANHVKVSLDIRLVTNAGNGAKDQIQLISTTAMAVWTADDWKDASVPPGRQIPPADLGTPAFNANGWKAIQEGDIP
jgi:hypothetical protein